MTNREHDEFSGFCEQATDAQLLGIIEKEREFADTDEFRRDCLRIALAELKLRNYRLKHNGENPF